MSGRLWRGSVTLINLDSMCEGAYWPAGMSMAVLRAKHIPSVACCAAGGPQVCAAAPTAILRRLRALRPLTTNGAVAHAVAESREVARTLGHLDRYVLLAQIEPISQMSSAFTLALPLSANRPSSRLSARVG